MAEQEQQAQQNKRVPKATFPRPPPFYKHFTKQNQSALRQLRKENASQKQVDGDDRGEPHIDIPSLPLELRYLVPPEPPAEGKWKSFGVRHDLAQPSQTLEAAGKPQLYPDRAIAPSHPDPSPHLLSLTRSILANFLELVGILSVNPEQYTEKLEHLSHLFYNVHDLINRYRPHQARESLILMMEEQLDRVRSEVQRVGDAKERIRGMLKGMQQLGEQNGEGQVGVEQGQQKAEDESARRRKEQQRSAWAALHEEMG